MLRHEITYESTCVIDQKMLEQRVSQAGEKTRLVTRLIFTL